jgi:PPK2 family polyphosphate:nucleotide phosphotransferase
MATSVDSLSVKEGEHVDLSARPTRIAPLYDSKKDYKAKLREQVKALSKLQRKFYAANTYSLLLIFQAMDTAGKDGAIRHVMSGVNPQGCQVTSFKHPSAIELDHDFLWRTAQSLPERGRIGIFNRSYYEEVLIVRVHPEILRAENLPDEVLNDDNIWRERFRSIVDHERHLHYNGTRILKFFLHLSPGEQSKRLLARIDDPGKNWKFNPDDIEERRYWDEYMDAYAKCISATSTSFAPWHVIPADDKRNARLCVSRIILDALDGLDIDFPTVTRERLGQMQTARERLLSGVI